MEQHEVLSLLKRVTGAERVKYDAGQNSLLYFDDISDSWLHFGGWNQKTEQELKMLGSEMADSFDYETDF